MAFDQDAVDEAVRVLQPQIDALQTQIDDLNTQTLLQKPQGYVVRYPDGTSDAYDLVASV